jgi:hypothetical protein
MDTVTTTRGMTDTEDRMSPLVVTQQSAPAVAPLGAAAVAHREDFHRYVLDEAEPWHREHLGRLYELWEEWNRAHFAAAMVPPYILLNEPVAPNVYGDCGVVSGFGGRSQIRLRPSLLWGTHPVVRDGGAFAAGRFIFVADVLLHEMIHQWQQEITGTREKSYHGHGPTFRDRANAIGAVLGLPPVRTCKSRGKDADLPSCSQWPHNVRPPDFYMGAYVTDRMAPQCFTVPAEPGALGEALARLLTPEDAAIVAGTLVRCFGLDPTALVGVPTSGDAYPREQEAGP